VASVLHLLPNSGRTSPINAVSPLTDDTLKAQAAGVLENVGAIPVQVINELNAVIPPAQQLLQPSLSLKERQVPHISSINLQNIKSEQARPLIIPAAVERIEIADAVPVETGNLTVEHDRVDPQREYRLDDLRITVGPVISATRAQDHALADPAGNEAVAVVLYLVNPFPACRRFRCLRGNAGLEAQLWYQSSLLAGRRPWAFDSIVEA
jgi:hypothetical protein